MFSVVIPMAGSGSRSGLNVNKALYMFNGKPLFMYAVDVFKKYNAEIILVCRPSEMDEIKEFISSDIKITLGGDTRGESVYNGIKEASKDIVLIHDAARPFIKENIIDDILNKLEDNKCAYVGIKCKDTVRENGIIINRDNLVLAQTPQAGYKKDFIYALECAKKDNVTLTDDISYLEKYLGYKPALVIGSELNFKVTTPDDIKIASALLGGHTND